MKRPGAVLLISCYELGHQPLGLALPLGFLERAGYAPAALDLSIQPLDPAAVIQARCVGISVPMHTALRLGVEAARRIRAINPTAHLCFFGLYASLNAEYLLAHGADSVIGGEYEAPLVALIETLAAEHVPSPHQDGERDGVRGGDGVRGVEGVTLRSHRSEPWLERLDFAVPSRATLPPLEQYAHLEHNGSRVVTGYVEASRGCLHLCLHCPIPPVYEGRFFVVPEAVVLEDIRAQVKAGARHITFGDADFLNGPGHSLRIVRAMHEEFPDLTFDVTAKIEHLLKHRAFLPELAACGCLFVISAVESLSDTVLAHLEKGHTRADVVTTLAILRETGIVLRPSFVAFTPWTTLADYRDLFEFVEQEGLIDTVDPVQYTIRLLIPPGSLLLEREAIKPFLGPLVPEALAYRWTHPDPRMDRLHQDVARAVEQAGAVEEDPSITFDRLRALAHAALGGTPPVRSSLRPDRVRSPRLTEPWFCCAEPTEAQRRPFQMKAYAQEGDRR